MQGIIILVLCLANIRQTQQTLILKTVIYSNGTISYDCAKYIAECIIY